MAFKEYMQRIEAEIRRIVEIREDMEEEFRRIELAKQKREAGGEKVNH